MDLSEYIREILKKIPEKINIKSPDPGQVVMYLVLGILGVFVFITIIRPVASFFMDRRKRNKIISKGMLFWKDFEKTGSAPGEAGEALPVISIRTVPAAT